MDRRLLLFVVLSFAIWLGYPALMQRLFPRPPAPRNLPAQGRGAKQRSEEREAAGRKAAGESRERAGGKARPQPAIQAPPQPERPKSGSRSARPIPDEGSLPHVGHSNHQGGRPGEDRADSPRYRDIEVRCGYLGIW